MTRKTEESNKLGTLLETARGYKLVIVCHGSVLMCVCVCSVRAGDGVGPAVPGVPGDVLVPEEAEHQQADAEVSAKGEEES